ncbi:MAG: ATP-binding cassette domain-containing protein [Syntrophomonas sp.]|nr:ATP-binding cassette domain-containing protein [Syntrophomonas sp.]
MAYIIETRNLHFHYNDGTCALHGINLVIPRHGKTAVLGPNGAGKSTLFLHFNGLLQPSSGSLVYCGETVSYQRSRLKQLRQQVGLVFPNPDTQLFSASVAQDISFGLLNLGYSQSQARRQVDEVAHQLGIEELLGKPTHFLSTGQKKLVALAGVLVMNPEVIVCDEPTAGLDHVNARILLQVLDQLHQQGTTLIISTHDVDLAYGWTSHVILISGGQVLSQGHPQQVLADTSLLKASSLDKPWILESWESLQKSGQISSELPPPASREEYFQTLASPTGKHYDNKVISFSGNR